jgi:hypothetical protein
MIRFIQQLFCQHEELKFVRNIYGDEINTAGGDRSIWRCQHCNKLVYQGKLHYGSEEQEIPYGIGKLLKFAGKKLTSPVISERAPPHLYLTRRECIEVGNYLKELGL